MTQQIETETYGILSNVDFTIMKLNPLIKKDGYKFVSISLHDLELKFSEVFNISRHFKPKQGIIKSIQKTVDGELNTISEQFDEALKQYFALRQYSNEALQLPPDHEVYLLKRIDSTFTEQGDNYIFTGGSSSAEIKLTSYVKNLIRKLRLHKKGQINFEGYFSIFKKDRRVISKHKTPNQPIHSELNYSISDDDIEELTKLLDKDIDIPELLKLAIESFELAFETSDRKIRFVLFMIALESIFNKSSSDPIMHILSRHTSLLLSKDRDEFDTVFQQVKHLYNTRSYIVHGTTDKNRIKKLEANLNDHLKELEQLTRQVILKCLWLNDITDKNTLFDYLNKRGFEG
jgi:hypothetical protein